MTMLKTGLLTSARKENEKRVPIHPNHFEWIPSDLRRNLLVEQGYGQLYGYSDEQMAACGIVVAGRAEISQECDAVIIMKPMAADLRDLREGGVVWGFPHCVQNRDMAQAAIDRRLTLIAWEEMYQGQSTERRGMRVKNFYRQNELAGYAGVFHALQLFGIDGHYGPQRKAVIISFGSVSRGAAFALLGCGFNDITVYTLRPPYRVVDQLFACKYGQVARGRTGEADTVAVEPDGTRHSFVDVLAEADVVVNGILQDPEAPLTFMGDGDIGRLKPGCLILDISCDHGMGFPFATPTTFDEPTFRVGQAIYYGVDHTPSFLWDAASWIISEALLPHLATVMGGAREWAKNDTISGAIEIRDGVVQNPKILTFQKRVVEYPHESLD